MATALELLDDVGPDAFSITKLAKCVGASPMSLYTYFPSRDALLDAVADHLFTTFAIPADVPSWQDFVFDWLKTLAALFERHPAALEVIAWDGHLSAGWLRAWLPLVRTLASREPDPKRLTFAVGWFSQASIGLVRSNVSGRHALDKQSDSTFDMFPADKALLLDVLSLENRAAPDALLEFGFRNIVAGLEALFDSGVPDAI